MSTILAWFVFVTLAVGPMTCMAAVVIIDRRRKHKKKADAKIIVSRAEPSAVVPYVVAPGFRNAKGQVEFWGFFHTTCVHESAAALVSLHTTKANAWRAMHRAQWFAWEAVQREPGERRVVFSGEPRARKDWFSGRAYVFQRSHVAPIALVE